MHPDLQTSFDEVGQFAGVARGDGFIVACSDLATESGEVLGEEGRSQVGEFIEEAAEGPDIDPAIVLGIIPDLRTGIVGCAGLCLGVLAL